MPEFYQDPALSEANKNNNRTSNGNSTQVIDQSDITEEKEREGYYPNMDLDFEMQGYTYGDKVSTHSYYNNYYDRNYRNNKYNSIYDPKRRQYNPDN